MTVKFEDNIAVSGTNLMTLDGRDPHQNLYGLLAGG